MEIYEDGHGGWILEVEDEFKSSVVWEDSFPSDEAALKVALQTIDEEGIDALIGAEPSGH